MPYHHCSTWVRAAGSCSVRVVATTASAVARTSTAVVPSQPSSPATPNAATSASRTVASGSAEGSSSEAPPWAARSSGTTGSRRAALGGVARRRGCRSGPGLLTAEVSTAPDRTLTDAGGRGGDGPWRSEPGGVGRGPRRCRAYPGDVTMLSYSLLRIMLLFGCMLVLWLVGVRDPVWLLLATAVSSVALSYVVLRGPREELARQLAARVDERTARRRSDAEVEDAELDRELNRDPERELDRDLNR